MRPLSAHHNPTPSRSKLHLGRVRMQHGESCDDSMLKKVFEDRPLELKGALQGGHEGPCTCLHGDVDDSRITSSAGWRR